MSNTIKTLTAGDITRKALSILHNNLCFSKTINREYDDRFARSGAKNGGTLQIREPNQFTVRSGAVMDTQDVTETTKELVIATQRGVDINFSSVELTLSLDDFADRILRPAMSRLAAEVDKINIAAMYPYVYKYVNPTPGTVPSPSAVLSGRAELQQGLAPLTDRVLMMGALEANGLLLSAQTFYNPASEISRQYSQGKIGNIYGFEFYESEMVPTHTAGTRTDATPTCYTTTSATTTTTAGIFNGRATVRVSGGSTGTTLKAGDVFTIVGIRAVNPETKTTCAWLQQFSITADTNVTTVATLWPVSPTPYISGAKQNMVAITASIGATVVCTTGVRVTGSASEVGVQSLAYHKDAFTMVSADLEMPQGVDFAYREVFDGVSMRLVRQYDIINDKFPCRIDVLIGQLCTRPEWAVRLAT